MSKVRGAEPKNNGGFFSPAAPSPTGSSTDLGLLLMALIWGFNFPLIKASLGEIPPLAFNALRFPLAALTVFLLLAGRGRIAWPAAEDWPRVVAMGILGNVAYQGFFIFGVNGTLAGNASVLLATTPVWTLAMSRIRGHEAPGALVWIGIFSTLSGMILIVLGGELEVAVHGSTLLGDLLMVGAAMTWSTYTVGCRRLVQKYGSVPVTAWTLWIGSPVLVILGLPSLTHLDLHQVSAASWFGVGYAGVFAIGLAYLLWYRGVQRIGNSRTAAYQNLTPVVALAVAWFWLGETPSFFQILGAGVVLAGLYLARTGGRWELRLRTGRGRVVEPH